MYGLLLKGKIGNNYLLVTYKLQDREHFVQANAKLQISLVGDFH
jgi:hypothetical protein